MMTAVLLLGALRLLVWLLCLAAAAQLCRVALGRLPSRVQVDPGAQPAPAPPDLPAVTVQLPLRNERYVAERAIRAACALDWPADRLEVQVLDDSDDETVDVVDRTVDALRAAGHDVRTVRRADRRGYKAGHLQHALASARGEYIAVLDADCVPPRDFLQRLLPPLLADATLGFAQGRWSFENEEEGLLTRVQALILHGLMLVEQVRLSRLGLPLQFNGSGGVWRRAALTAAGGWLPEGRASVTEDMDLSFRVRLRGYRGLQVPEVAVRTELPRTMGAFRAQQQRWVRGGAQVLRALGRDALSAPAAMLGHLVRHGRQPLLALFCLAQPLAALGVVALPPAPIAWAAALLGLHAALALYYGTALRRLGRSPLRAALLAPALVALSLGLSLCLTAALLRGLFEDRARSVFVRTPKTGGVVAASGLYRPPRDRLAWLEVLLGLVHLGAALHLVFRGDGHGDVAAGLATLLFLSGGLLWVGVGSLLD